LLHKKENAVKTLLTYIAIVIIQIVALIPLPISRILGAWTGKLLWLTNSSMAKVSRINVAHCYPDLSESEVDKLARQSVIETGITVFEIGMCWVWPPAWALKKVTKVRGGDLFQAALKNEGGTILMSPHLGNWEMINHFVSQYAEMTVMYKTAKVPAFDNWMQRVRMRTGLFLVPADKQGVFALYDLLKNQKVIGVLPDQEPSRKSGIFAPFFGRQALTGKLVGDLMVKNPTAIALCCYALRLPDGNYEVVFKQIKDEVRNADPLVSATALNESIEICVADCPEQYQWSYKRFRLQAEGKTLLYK
jgi:KDO2-lipid IV(A) lauroyltransferase